MSDFVSVQEMAETANYAAQRAVREELFEMKFAVKTYMDKGLSSEEVPVATQMQDALNAAEGILDKIFS